MTVKEIGIIAGIAVLVFGSGAATGRYFVPAEVRQHDTVIDRGTTVINQTVDIDALVKQLKDIQQRNNVRREKTTVKTPDGMVTEKEVETDQSETNTHTDTTTQTKTKVDLHVLDDKLHLEDHIKEKIVRMPQPNWLFGVQGGYLFASLFGKENGLDLIKYHGLFVGGSVSRRIADVPWFGNLWFGIFANSAGAAGLDLRLECCR